MGAKNSTLVKDHRSTLHPGPQDSAEFLKDGTKEVAATQDANMSNRSSLAPSCDGGGHPESTLNDAEKQGASTSSQAQFYVDSADRMSQRRSGCNDSLHCSALSNVVDSVQSVHSFEQRYSIGSGGRHSTGRSSVDTRGAMPQRGSMDKRNSVGGHSRASVDSQAGSARSARSSFALEGNAPESTAAADLTRVPHLPAQLMLQGSLFLQQLPQELHSYYKLLAVLPVGNPVPLTMLQRLWGCTSYGEAEHVAQALSAHGIVRIAELDDLTVWCLPGPDHVHFLAAVQEKQLQGMHQQLLDIYCQGGAVQPGQLADDGYILNSLGHHLFWAGRVDELQALLVDPCWLEQKLQGYGVAAVVADYRRYLQLREDSLVKALLLALQMSLSCCTQHPTIPMLWSQMLNRTLALAATGQFGMDDWHRAQLSKWRQHAQHAKGAGVLHLLARTCSVQQSGGLYRSTLRGHTAQVKTVVISPSGQQVVTASSDGTAQVWDMDIGDSTLQLGNGRDPLTCVMVSPDGAAVITASQGGNLSIWDLATGQLQHCLPGHKGKINAVAMDSQGARLVTAGDDSTARVWDVQAARCLQVLAEEDCAGLSVNDVAMSADGVLVAAAYDDFSVRVWDLDDQQLLHTLQGHSGWVVSVRFLGRSHKLITGSHDCTARVWDAWAGTCLATLEGHTGRINRVAVDEEGTVAVTASDDNTCRVWDVARSGQCTAVLEGHSAWLNDVVVAKDCRSIVTVSGDGTGMVWDASSGQCLKTLEGHGGEALSVVLTSRGRFAVTGSADCTARVWDLQAPRIALAAKHRGAVKSVQALGRGPLVATSGEDCCIRLWDCRTGAALGTGEAHKVAPKWLVSPQDGTSLLAGSGDRRVWQLDASTFLDGSSGSGSSATAAAPPAGDSRISSSSSSRELPGRIVLPDQLGSRVKSMAFDAACSRAAVVLFDSTLSIWDLAAGTCLVQLIKRGERDGTRVHNGGVNEVYLTRGGQRAVSVSKDCTARVWDVAAGETSLLLAGHTDGIYSAALSADERLLATASYDCTARLWDLGSGACLATLPHKHPVTALALAPDASLLVTVTEGPAAWLWDLRTGRCRARLAGHKEEVAGVLFTPDSRYVVSYGQDCTVQVWACDSGRQHAVFMTDSAVNSCCLVSDSGAEGAVDVIVAGVASGSVHFIEVKDLL